MLNLKIENSIPVQENFWGNGAVYHGYAGMPDDAGRVYSEEFCELEAKRAVDMRLKIARTFYGWWAWDKNTNTWDWENEKMRPFYKWLQRMKDGNVTVALNTGWCSPGDINSTYWNGVSPFTVEGDWNASVQNYADWVSETLHQLVEIRGFTNIKILVLFTEPQHLNGVSHEGKNAYECWAEASRAVHDTLIRDGRRDMVKLMGPNEGSTTTSEMLKWVAENCNDFIDIFSSHTYLFDPPIRNKYVKSGKAMLTASIAGGRFCKSVDLKPNTDYILSVDALYEPSGNESQFGDIKFGIFKYEPHEKEGFCEPLTGVVNDSIAVVDVSELSNEYKRFSLKFNSGDQVKGIAGVFHDVKTYGLLYVDQMILTQADDEVNLIENGDFSNNFDGWHTFFSGATVNAHDDWYKWAKTGLQYVPENKQYCFDEYNTVYDRDNDRINHGSDIVCAAVALMNAGVQFSLLWTLFDQQWPNSHNTNNDSFFDGDHRCGVMPVLTRSLVPRVSYYAFSLLSRYVDGGDGTRVYRGVGDDKTSTTMCVSNSGDITVVVVNDSENSQNFTINFDEALNVKFNRHCFNPETCVPDEKAEIIGTDATFEVKDTLSDEIAAYGVIVYTTHID